MTNLAPLATLLGSATLSVVLVWLVRIYALRSAMLDHPEGRSSHAAPTPRGGGLGAIIAIAAVWMAVGLGGSVASGCALAGLATVGAVGWIDDHSSLPPGVRLIFHAIAAALLIPLFATLIEVSGWVYWVAAGWWCFVAVSAVNITNFMDGIDGLIGSQMAAYGLHLALLAPGWERPGLVGLALAGGALGFLVWNWPPARIFLGDVGSGALGLAAVVAGMVTVGEVGIPQWSVFLPFFPITADSASTILRRLGRRERITQPHRGHLYQRLANEGGWGHARVTLLYLAASALAAVSVQGWLELGSALPAVGYVTLVLAVGLALDRSLPMASSAPSNRF